MDLFSTMMVEGQLAVGDFEYLPAQEGDKVKSNQVQNTAFWSVFFEKNIDEHLETVLFLEPRFLGIELGDDYANLYGEINDFLIDDLGFSIEWALDVRYVIDGCYDQAHVSFKKTEKFGLGSRLLHPNRRD